MLRRLLAVVCMMTSTLCVADDMSQAQSAYEGGYCALHVGQGLGRLLVQQYDSALEDFDTASASIFEQGVSNPEMDFLISFGRAVAYDNLGYKDRCEQALGALLIAICECPDNDDVDASGDGNGSTLSNELILGILKDAASLAQTPKVRKALMSLVDEMMDDDSSDQVEQVAQEGDGNLYQD